MPQTPASPVAPNQRIQAIDAIRGFALTGVLLSNLLYTSQWFATPWEIREQLPTPTLDAYLEFAIIGLVEWKFYTLFTLLFGFGIAMQLHRAKRASATPRSTLLTRMLILLILGVAHATLLWFGDILHRYALVGMLVILLAPLRTKHLLIITSAIASLAMLLPTIAPLFNIPPQPPPPPYFETMATGDYPQIVAMNIQILTNRYTNPVLTAAYGVIYWSLTVTWKILLGYCIGAMLFRDARSIPRRTLKRALPWLFAFGLTACFASVTTEFFFDTRVGASDPPLSLAWIVIDAGVLSLALAYALAIYLLADHPRAAKLMQPLVPFGRMALTNYITQSLCIVLIFYAPGLALIGKLGVTACLLITPIILALQIYSSRWWLNHYRFGPLEWLWRSATYARLQPLRKTT